MKAKSFNMGMPPHIFRSSPQRQACPPQLGFCSIAADIEITRSSNPSSFCILATVSDIPAVQTGHLIDRTSLQSA